MKTITQALVLIGLGMSSVAIQAAPGYVDDSANSVVRTGYGDCLHTGRWSVPNAIAECDPEIVAKRDAADVAAVEVIMVTKENPVRLQADTLFAFDSADLTSNGKAALNDMLGKLTAESLQNQKLEIRGYTDEIGTDAYNLDLSKRRAAAVRDYLVSQGMVPSFISMQGLGKADPVVDCAGKRGATLIECLGPNRRTEIEFSAVEVMQVEETVPVKKP
ncbi:MAG: OmpA family protein [Thiogranum sp.]|jgi:OOP family OmpA-OmpF porin|nr:OmpA family protein [Thiogranum sp.]